MRKLLVPSALGILLALAACLTAPEEPGSSSADALACKSNERAFNGACRTTCSTTADCAGAGTCTTVAKSLSLCIEAGSCAYLGNDTTCAGVPYGASYNYDPYWTSSPYDGSSVTSYYGGITPFGCAGNAAWESVTPSALDDPKCGAEHTVVRCQKVGRSCKLVRGTTIDVADP